MKPVSIMPANLDWPSAIGHFLLNFGTLDYFVFVFLKKHLSPEEFADVKEKTFRERIRRIAQHLKDKNYPLEEQAAFARMVERVEPFRELRNHIAHGHMYLRLDADGKAAVTVFKAKDLDMGYLPDSKHVEFEELERALETLPQLIEEFERLAGFKASVSGPFVENLKK